MLTSEKANTSLAPYVSIVTQLLSCLKAKGMSDERAHAGRREGNSASFVWTKLVEVALATCESLEGVGI